MFFITTYLNKEVIRTEPSLLVRVPWCRYRNYLALLRPTKRGGGVERRGEECSSFCDGTSHDFRAIPFPYLSLSLSLSDHLTLSLFLSRTSHNFKRNWNTSRSCRSYPKTHPLSLFSLSLPPPSSLSFFQQRLRTSVSDTA